MPLPSPKSAIVLALLCCGCLIPEIPTSGIWTASCDAAPPMQLEFPNVDDPDPSGLDRRLRATLRIPLDSSGLSDIYRMQLHFFDPGDDGFGSVETEWMEHAPLPSAMSVDAELKMLSVEVTNYGFNERPCNRELFARERRDWTIEGTCSWGIEQGEFVASATESACNSSGAGVSWMAAIAFGVVMSRRRQAWWLLLLVGCKGPEGRWLGNMGKNVRIDLGIPDKDDEIAPFGTVWARERPGDVTSFSCNEVKMSMKRFSGMCAGIWSDGERVRFSVDAERTHESTIDRMTGSFSFFEGVNEAGSDSTLSLLLMGPPPESNVDPVLITRTPSDVCETTTTSLTDTSTFDTSTSYTTYTTPSQHPILFATTAKHNGDMGGIAGADTICANEYSQSGLTFKALLVDGFYRLACETDDCSEGESEHVDWPLRPMTTYYRPDGETIGTTNEVSLFPFPLENLVDPENGEVWTGLYSNWKTANNCSGWSSGSKGAIGATGKSKSQDFGMIFSHDQSCDHSDVRIYCVEI